MFEGKRLLKRPSHRWKDIKICKSYKGRGGLDPSDSAQRLVADCIKQVNKSSSSTKDG
jgi:hypothetical protein